MKMFPNTRFAFYFINPIFQLTLELQKESCLSFVIKNALNDICAVFLHKIEGITFAVPPQCFRDFHKEEEGGKKSNQIETRNPAPLINERQHHCV